METKNELVVLDEMQNKVREITKFEQTVEDLEAIVAKAQKITVKNIEDKEQLALAKATRIELRQIEIQIERRGKGYRDVFNSINKEISKKEKDLLAITAPEIERLEKIEAEAKEIAIRKARMEAIPVRQERLKEIGVIATDEELMKMDDDGFKTFVNTKIEEKNEQERQKLEVEKAKLEAEKRAIERTKELEEAKEKTRKETEKRIKEQQALKEKQEKEKKERDEKAKLEAEAKREKELAEQKEYQNFLSEHGYSEETKSDFIIEKVGNKIRLAKILGIFTIK